MDYQKGLDFLQEFEGLPLPAFRRKYPELYQTLRNHRIPDTTITNAINNAANWCRIDYEDGIQATRLAQHYEDATSDNKITSDDFYNLRNFIQKTAYRLHLESGENHSREINQIKLAEQQTNARDNSLSENIGNILTEPLKSIQKITPILDILVPKTSAILNTLILADTTISQNEIDYKKERQGIYSDTISKEHNNTLSEILLDNIEINNPLISDIKPVTSFLSQYIAPPKNSPKATGNHSLNIVNPLYPTPDYEQNILQDNILKSLNP